MKYGETSIADSLVRNDLSFCFWDPSSAQRHSFHFSSLTFSKFHTSPSSTPGRSSPVHLSWRHPI
jgi:hypothetical protein